MDAMKEKKWGEAIQQFHIVALNFPTEELAKKRSTTQESPTTTL